MPKTSRPVFTPDQFTPYDDPRWGSAVDKARYANHFVRFVLGGFRSTQFPRWFYVQTSFMWGHIAEYSRDGFYATWLADTPSRARFLTRCVRGGGYGSPTHTYVDVERAIASWVRDSGVLETTIRAAVAEVERTERANLARLQAKYPTPD